MVLILADAELISTEFRVLWNKDGSAKRRKVAVSDYPFGYIYVREYNPASEYRFVSNVPDNNVILGCFPPQGKTNSDYNTETADVDFPESPILSLFMDKLVALCLTAKSFSGQKGFAQLASAPLVYLDRKISIIRFNCLFCLDIFVIKWGKEGEEDRFRLVVIKCIVFNLYNF